MEAIRPQLRTVGVLSEAFKAARLISGQLLEKYDSHSEALLCEEWLLF